MAELIGIHQAAKLLGVSSDYLYDALDGGFFDWVLQDGVSMLRKEDLKKIPMSYSKPPPGYMNWQDAGEFLSIRLLKHLPSKKLGKIRVYKISDLEAHMPPRVGN